MFGIFEKLRSFVAWILFQAFAWVIIPVIVLLLCLFRVRLPERYPDGQGCMDECDPAPDTQDAVALQDEMSGVRR